MYAILKYNANNQNLKLMPDVFTICVAQQKLKMRIWFYAVIDDSAGKSEHRWRREEISRDVATNL